jgi:phage terminase large subunit-like protein
LADVRTIELYGAQHDFVACDDRFAAFVGGVGSGKTFAGAAKALYWAAKTQGLGLVVAPTYPMLRDSTLRTVQEVFDGAILDFHKTEMRAEVRGGAEVLFRSADDPDRLRGPNLHWTWMDEAAMCPKGTWEIIIGRLRAGGQAGPCWVTTTPKGRNWLYKRKDDMTLFRASTRDNPYVSSEFVDSLDTNYSGAFKLQEIEGEFIEDAEGAIWKRQDIDAHRVSAAPDLMRVVVAIDPSATGKETSDEAGIVVAGWASDGHAYVLEDRTLRASPHGWGSEAVQAYHRWQADRIVAETNNGGEMVELTVRTVDDKVPYKGIHASRGKRTRAEPVAALYEQGKVHHVGDLTALESEMCLWEPGDASPNRMDALVWALTELMLERAGTIETQENPFY